MDIATLQAFLAVADTGSFSRAAEKIFLTQPAISKRIASLETELGTRLFDRIGRQVHLTPAGQELHTQARAILGELENAKRRIANLSGTISGPITLGTSYHIGLHRLPPALKAFNQTYPGVDMDLRFMDSELACLAVEQGELELAVVTLPAQAHVGLHFEPVWEDRLQLVVGSAHPLAKAGRTSLDKLVQYPAILPAEGTYTRDLILAALPTLGERLRVATVTNHLDVIKMLVSVGLGWSALPQTLIDDDLKVVHIDKIEIRRSLGLVTHATRTLSNAARAMIQTVRQTA